MTNTGKDRPDTVTALTEEKRRLLACRLGMLSLAQPGKATISAKTDRTCAPLSLTQQRLWLVERLEPEHSINNVIRMLSVRGNLDQAALEAAFNNIVARHEILRTTFNEQNGEARQKIASHAAIRLTVINLTGTAAAQQEEAERIARREATHSFDITGEGLMRVVLLAFNRQEHILMITLHHIISDGWSIGILFRELEACYRAALRGEPAKLSPLPVQYGDYAEWQRAYLRGDAIAPLVEFWKKQLRDAPRLALPQDRRFSNGPDYYTDIRSLQLSTALTEKIKGLAQQENSTLFMTLLACFKVLLFRYSGTTDIVIGTPISGRHGLDEIKDLIGFFVNTLVLRTDLSGNPSFRQVLGRVRKTALDAYHNSSLPFDKVVEVLNPERRERRMPFFDVMINFHEASWHQFRLEGLDVEERRLAEPLTDFSLSLDIMLEADGLRLDIRYKPSLFEEWRIKRMLGHLQTLLEACVAHPHRPIAALPLLTNVEWTQLAEWNDTAADYDRALCVQTVFEQWAGQSPQAIALTCHDDHISYADLNSRANRLAHLLMARGVGPESRVGICMARSIDAVVAMLAIAKAGGAYLPLDASYPQARLRFMLDDSRATLVLTHEGLLPRTIDCPVIDLGEAAAEIGACADRNPAGGDDPERLLYVMYTSGSTGTPKGVEVPHRAVNRLVQRSGVAAFGADQVFMLLAPLSFDAATFEVWGALLNGGRCVIYPERLPEFATLQRTIRDNGVTTLWLTASLFNKVIDEAPQTLAGVKQLLTGGEALSVDHIRRAQQALPDTQFINGYGPTENTTFTCCYAIPRPLSAGLMSIPIGRPIGNTRVYILDPQLQCVPAGVPGELYAAGAGLARGYLNRPDLTMERFIENPFSNVPGARLYKSGDLARYLPDGNIEYLGRLDHQIKLRGFRIELGEIETVLRQHPAVKDCVVTVREDTPGDRRLVAYVTPAGDAPDPRDLKALLKAKLPEYMVPAHIHCLDAFPLTSSGKIDRKALPAPQRQRGVGQDFIAPRTPYETQMSAIWAEVLSLDHPGIHDNFFELGGHSLLATKIIARINRAFATQLPLRALFDNPTIADLAAAIVKSKTETVPGMAMRDMLTQLEDLSDADAEKILRGKTWRT